MAADADLDALLPELPRAALASPRSPPTRGRSSRWDAPPGLIIGAYAHRRYVDDFGATITDSAARWRELIPDRIVLPPPSPRNRAWLARNEWFEAEAVPALRDCVRTAFGRAP